MSGRPALMAILLVVFGVAAMVRHAKGWRPLDVVTDAELSADLLAARDHAGALGFVADGPPRMGDATHHAVPMLHRDKPICLVLVEGPNKLALRATLGSLFPDLAGAIATSGDEYMACTIAPPGSVRQVFVGASLEALVAHHERAVGSAAEQGLQVVPIEPGRVDELERWNTERMHKPWRAHPTWHAFVFVVRKLTGWSPYARPIPQQPGARRTIAKLVAGGVHAVPVARVV